MEQSIGETYLKCRDIPSLDVWGRSATGQQAKCKMVTHIHRRAILPTRPHPPWYSKSFLVHMSYTFFSNLFTWAMSNPRYTSSAIRQEHKATNRDRPQIIRQHHLVATCHMHACRRHRARRGSGRGEDKGRGGRRGTARGGVQGPYLGRYAR